MTKFKEARISSIIEKFYAAAADPTQWRAVLHEMSDILGAEGICVFPGPKSNLSPVASDGLDAPLEYGIQNGWFLDNPRVTRGTAFIKRPDDLVTESMLFSPAELDRLPYNAEFVDRFDLRWFVGGLLVPDGAESAVFSVERRKDQERFSNRELELVRAMLPHFQRAGRIGVEWAKARAAGMADAFEQMGSGAILLDYQGRVVRMSARAEAHVGSAITIAHKHLLATDKAANVELQRLIGSIIRTASDLPKLIAALPRALGRPLIAYASPLIGTTGELFQSAQGIIVLTDPDERLPIADMALRQMFRLTQAEIQLAKQIALSVEVAEAARTLGIAVSTARTQLKAIFAKTNTHRQSELAVLLSRLVANGDYAP
jgi:DNA-binding CsgD family transcriptional regulator